MLVAAPLLAKVALSFQSAEYFGLGLLGLSCISSIAAKDPVKGHAFGNPRFDDRHHRH